MKALISDNVIVAIGDIALEGDSYLCGGCAYPANANQIATVPDDAQVGWINDGGWQAPPAPPAPVDAEDIKRQIAAIEAGQARAVREAALTGDTTYLAKIEAQIAALRAQL